MPSFTSSGKDTPHFQVVLVAGSILSLKLGGINNSTSLTPTFCLRFFRSPLPCGFCIAKSYPRDNFFFNNSSPKTTLVKEHYFQNPSLLKKGCFWLVSHCKTTCRSSLSFPDFYQFRCKCDNCNTIMTRNIYLTSQLLLGQLKWIWTITDNLIYRTQLSSCWLW